MRRVVRGRRSLTSAPPKLCVYLSAHGYGHTVRTAEVLVRLAELIRFQAEVVCPAPRMLWPASLAGVTEWRAQATDAGVVQSDDVNVDVAATETAVDGFLAGEDALVASEAKRLEVGAFDLVVGDVPPAAFRAARLAGVPSIAIANFSWDWIYERLGLHRAAEAAREAYACCDLLAELEPAAPMPAFRERESVGVLGRRSRVDRTSVRQELGIAVDARLVVLGFRSGIGSVVTLPPRRDDIVYACVGRPTVERADIVSVDRSFPYVDLVGAADAVVSKPGYGVLGDAAGAGVPLLYVPRSGFPEDPILERWLDERSWAWRIEADRMRAGAWQTELDAALDARPAAPHPIPGAPAIARLIATRLGA